MDYSKHDGLSAAALKYIACVAMVIDHAASVLIQGSFRSVMVVSSNPHVKTLTRSYHVMRGIGRISFPIFVYFIIEGFLHTRSKIRYFFRLLLFAALTEPLYDYAMYGQFWRPDDQNVLFELAAGLLLLIIMDYIKTSLPVGKWLYYSFITVVAMVTACITEKLCFDYGMRGILLFFVLYLFHSSRLKQSAAGMAVLAIRNKVEIPAVFSFLLLSFYNGKRGKQWKYFFYFFYPAHLLLLKFIFELTKFNICAYLVS